MKNLKESGVLLCQYTYKTMDKFKITIDNIKILVTGTYYEGSGDGITEEHLPPAFDIDNYYIKDKDDEDLLLFRYGEDGLKELIEEKAIESYDDCCENYKTFI